MADFHIYPDPSTAPLDLAAGATSAAIPIEELHAVGASTLEEMYIRILCIGAPLPAGVHPSVIFQVDAGADTPMVLNSFTEIYGDSPPPPQLPTVPIAGANLELVSVNIYRVSIYLETTGATWKIKIKNNDSVSRKFTFVVGKTDADTQKPWLHASDTLDFGQLLPTEVLALSSTVQNWGTGPLTITDVAGPIAGTPFTLGAPPAAIDPNGSGNVSITFTAPATPGEVTASYDITSNDPGALTSVGSQHNRRLGLKAQTGMLEIVLLLDASGSMSWKPDGSETTVRGESRFGLVETGLDLFFDLLGTYAPGKGKLGIATFPDTAPPDPSVPTSKVILPMTAVSNTGASDTVPPAARSAIAGTNPFFAGTPMGHGLATAMGPTSSPNNHGMFDNDPVAVANNRRFIILLSDGAHNLPAGGASPKPSDFYQAGAGTADGFHQKKIGLIGVAYGATGSPEVDKTTLSTLATESLEAVPLATGITSAEAFVDVIAEDGGNLIKKAFTNIVLKPLSLHAEEDPAGTLTSLHPERRNSVVVTPYDKKVSFVVGFDADNGLLADLHTPTCELITAATAAQFGVTFHRHRRYVVYTVPEAFLKNTANPSRPRHGTWTLILRRAPDVGANVHYQYAVITDSGIRMLVRTQANKHYAGDSIVLLATLSADGTPIRNASVTCHTTKPLDAVQNWLARTPIPKNAVIQPRAIADLEVSPAMARVNTLKSMGLVFTPSFAQSSIPMPETEQQGVYRAVIDTSVTGVHDFYIVAVGQTQDGVHFRRERHIQVYVGVRPKPDFSIVHIDYRQVILDQRPWVEADIRVTPRDPFGNVVLGDPALDGSVEIVTRGGKLQGPMVPQGNGTYVQTLRFEAETAPTFALRVAGEDVVKSYEVPHFEKLAYVDEVHDVSLGREAVKGANKHTDAKVVLGDIATKKPDEFLSLGGRGSLTLGLAKKQIIAAREVTVFVRPDEQLRSYAVEVLPLIWPRNWVRVGTSKGVTQTFSLMLREPPRGPKGESYLEVEGSLLGAAFSFDIHSSLDEVRDWLGWGKLGLKGIRAVRIVDTSDMVRNANLSVSESPGVSILGVGFNR